MEGFDMYNFANLSTKQQQHILATAMSSEKILWTVALEKLYPEFENKTYQTYQVGGDKNQAARI